VRNKVVGALIGAMIPACAGLAAGASGGLRLPISALVSYAACAAFLVGICLRVLRWAAVPVPFRIPATCGQQKSLEWIRSATLDNPATGMAAAGRMTAEVLLFRSLFRNTRCEVNGARTIFSESRWLWIGAIAFHWSLLLIVLRHLRLFVEPVPAPVLIIEQIDTCFQIGIPRVCISDIVFIAALCFLLWRRFSDPVVRYISLCSDFLVLWLIAGVALTGIVMRHWSRVDVAGVKQFALGLATFSPVLPASVGALFLVHLFLVCALVAYIPSSKLMHMAGVWLSPTRNLANNSRAVRHVNPWNYPVKTHAYAEWEAEYRDKLQAAGIPLEGTYVESTHTN